MSELATRVRAKFPGAYDDLSDADLEKAVLAKHPEYADLAQPKTAAPPAAPEPGMVDRLLEDNPALPPMLRATQGLLRGVKSHPVQAGAVAGGLLAAPLTGGASVPAAMAASGLGAAGGAALGSIANAAMGNEGGPRTATDVAKTMATEGALGAAGEGAGRAVGAGMKLLGRGAYRVALAPTQQILGKYGDVVGEGLETATPVSKSGLADATASKIARIGNKRTALAAADQNVTHSAGLVANDASGPLSDYATKQIQAGLPDPTGEIADRIAQFKAANPNGTLTPSKLDEIKATIDDVSGGAYRKVRMREPLTGSEKTSVEMTRAMSRANESAVPGYRDMNRSIMDAEGLRKAIERRTLGSGGNQVLDTLMAFMRGPAGIPGRVAMMPPVLSNAGIGLYKGAEGVAPALKAALIAALGGGGDQ